MAKALPAPGDSDFSDDDQSPLDISFSKAAEHLRKITNKLNNDQLLQLYGLYKQGLDGKCNTPKPGWFDGRGRKKWEAWNELGGLPQNEAKAKYIELIHKFDPEFENAETKAGPKEFWVAVSSLRRSPSPEIDKNKLSLLEAAREDYGERVAEILRKNPHLVDEKDEDGLTALHWAADRDACNSLKAAIDGGCPLDAVDDCGQTALHYSASCGHFKSTQILVDAGAKLIKDSEDCTPLDLATDGEVKNILEGANH